MHIDEAVAGEALAVVERYITAINAGDGSVDTPLERFFNTWVHNGLLVIACMAAWARVVMRASERGAWTAMAVAITAWSAGEFNYGLFLEGAANPPRWTLFWRGKGYGSAQENNLAGHRVAGGRCEIRDRAGDVFRRTRLAAGHAGKDLRSLGRRISSVQELGIDHAGAQRIHADSLGGELDAKRARECH